MNVFPVYALNTDLQSSLGSLYTSDLDRLLPIASDMVTRAIVAYCPRDNNGLPTDATDLIACKKATIAQVQAFYEWGEAHTLADFSASNLATPFISLDRGSKIPIARARLCPRAIEILSMVNLLTPIGA
jgi:hypothetical protein